MLYITLNQQFIQELTMAKGVFTKTIRNADLTGIAVSADTTEIKLGASINSIGSVSLQFTNSAQMTLSTLVKNASDLSYVTLSTGDFSVLPAGPYAAGTHLVQLMLPVCSLFKNTFTGAGDVTDIVYNIQ